MFFSNYTDSENSISEIIKGIKRNIHQKNDIDSPKFTPTKSIKKRYTLKEAQKKYRNNNKKCKYCMFSKTKFEYQDKPNSEYLWATNECLWCEVKDEKCGNKVCEFYQLEEEE